MKAITKNKNFKNFSKKEYETNLERLECIAKNYGAEMDHCLIDNDHLHPFWYNGQNMIFFTYKNHIIYFGTCGDVKFNIPDAEIEYDMEEFCFTECRENTPYGNDKVRKRIADDTALITAYLNGEMIFEKVNELAVSIFDIDAGDYISFDDCEVLILKENCIFDAVLNNIIYFMKYVDKKIKKETKR